MMWHGQSAKKISVILISCALLVSFLSCKSGDGSVTADSPVSLTTLDLFPATPAAAAGESVQFRAIGTYSDNSTQDLSDQVAWSSTNTTVATISGTGLAAVVGPGTTTISAASGSLTVSAALTGTSAQAVLTGLSVLPATPAAAIGAAVQFLAIGTYSDNSTRDLSDQVAWSSANTTVATITSMGVSSVVGAGITAIGAASGSLSASATLTGIPSATLTALAVSPAAQLAAVGATVQFLAVGAYSDNSTQDLSNQVTWNAANVTVATVSSTGLAAVLSAGTTTISAALGSLSADATLTGAVLAATLTGLSLSPDLQSAAIGSTAQFSATGAYSDSSTQDLSYQVAWSSSNPAVAAINGTGIATVAGAGTTTISAASGPLTASATLMGIIPQTTLTSVSVLPATPSAPAGTAVQFLAIGIYSDNSTQDLSNQVAWSSANITVATISSAGLAAVLSPGTAAISASSGSFAASATLTGTSAEIVLTGLSVLPETPSAAIGATVQFQAIGTYSDNSTQDLSNQVTWSSTNTTVAAIDSAGLAAVAGAGITTISAASGAVSASATLTTLGSADVLLYVTDNLSSYLQVIATFNRVRLVSSSAAVTCDVLTPPVTLDIANGANIMQFIAAVPCPAAQYNRIDLEFSQTVQLMDSAENTSECRFTSYLDNADQPNALQCDSATNTCTLEILGAVRSGAFDLLSTQENKLALDFDLQKFIVQNFGDPGACSLTMKVMPLHDADILQKGNPEVITGSISNLDPAAQTFSLARGNVNTTVSYAAVVQADHPGIDVLLQTAQTNGISAVVSSTDLGGWNSATIAASDLSIKLAGTVSNYTKTKSDHTFTLTYDPAKTMTILSAPPLGKKHGALADGAWVEVRLYGYDSASGLYLSSLVSVQKTGTKTDN